MRLGFKKWLEAMDRLSSAPSGAGEIWHSMTNADQDYGRKGAKSDYVASDSEEEESGIDPDKLFKGKPGKKKSRKIDKDNLRGGKTHGSSQ